MSETMTNKCQGGDHSSKVFYQWKTRKSTAKDDSFLRTTKDWPCKCFNQSQIGAYNWYILILIQYIYMEGRAKIIPVCQKMEPSKQVVLLWSRSKRMLETHGNTMEHLLFDSDEFLPIMHHRRFRWVLSLQPDQHKLFLGIVHSQEFGLSLEAHKHLGGS